MFEKHIVSFDLFIEGKNMAVSYRKLWKLLIDKDLKKTELRIMSGISTNALAKMGKNERVGTDVIDRVCVALKCDVGDVMEILIEKDEKPYNHFLGESTNE